MTTEWRTAKEAAEELGISVLTFYDWLARSDCGDFVIRGQSVTIRYCQGGRAGQGTIRIEAIEVDRLQEAMRVHPGSEHKRRRPVQRVQYPGINVPLGYPGE